MADVTIQFRPLDTWPWPDIPGSRKIAQFRATYPDTLHLLSREVRMLGADRVALQADIRERDIRTDGLPRANARIGEHPGVIVSFASEHGPLRYGTDTYTDWQDNLRAIALALEALRAVDRYGVSRRGEQYRGWLAIEAGNGAAFSGADEALAWMRGHAEGQLDLTVPAGISPRDLYRFMAKLMHPDRGGQREDWDRLDSARQLLAAGGLL